MQCEILSGYYAEGAKRRCRGSFASKHHNLCSRAECFAQIAADPIREQTTRKGR